MSEHAIQNEIWNSLAKPACRTFRANVGQAWTGSECIKLANGDMLIKNPRLFKTGLPTGFSDLFGLVQHTVTEEDVGKALALFYAIEVKAPKGKLSEQQERFLAAMTMCGARAGVARSVAEAHRIVFGEAGYEQG